MITLFSLMYSFVQRTKTTIVSESRRHHYVNGIKRKIFTRKNARKRALQRSELPWLKYRTSAKHGITGLENMFLDLASLHTELHSRLHRGLQS